MENQTIAGMAVSIQSESNDSLVSVKLAGEPSSWMWQGSARLTFKF